MIGFSGLLTKSEGRDNMEMMMRKDVPQELTWDLTSIYAQEEDLLRDTERMKQMTDAIEETYKGKLNTPEAIDQCLDAFRAFY